MTLLDVFIFWSVFVGVMGLVWLDGVAHGVHRERRRAASRDVGDFLDGVDEEDGR